MGVPGVSQGCPSGVPEIASRAEQGQQAMQGVAQGATVGPKCNKLFHPAILKAIASQGGRVDT